MEPKPDNYAFIDSQNLHLGIQQLGWQLDYRKFRRYLQDKYKIAKVFMFIGYIASNQNLYKALQEAGYILIFKQVMYSKDGKPKGNVDAELVLHCMIEYPHYNRALIITSDGDFACLADYLYRQGKLEAVLSPHVKTVSILLKRAARERIYFIHDLRKKLEWRK